MCKTGFIAVNQPSQVCTPTARSLAGQTSDNRPHFPERNPLWFLATVATDFAKNAAIAKANVKREIHDQRRWDRVTMCRVHPKTVGSDLQFSGLGVSNSNIPPGTSARKAACISAVIRENGRCSTT